MRKEILNIIGGFLMIVFGLIGLGMVVHWIVELIVYGWTLTAV